MPALKTKRLHRNAASCKIQYPMENHLVDGRKHAEVATNKYFFIKKRA
jgi:hypothetical protein